MSPDELSTKLAEVERILSQEEFESLEQRVAAQAEAIKILHRAMVDIALDLQRQIRAAGDRDPRNPHAPPGVRY